MLSLRTSGNGTLETKPSLFARARMLGNKCTEIRVIMGQVRRVLVIKSLFFETEHGEDVGPPG
jgi:hypothetical protein